MAVSAIVRTLGWAACVVYSTIPSFWLVIHSRAEYWRSRPGSPYRFLAPLWVVMWIAVALLTSRWREELAYISYWAWLPAAGFFVCGLWLYLQSRANFGLRQLIGAPELQADPRDQQLVTSGIRARVRHPVYLAHLCEMLAWSFGTGLAVCFGLTAFAVITGAVMIRTEDAELERRFGDSYRAYRKSVPAVLPKIGRA